MQSEIQSNPTNASPMHQNEVSSLLFLIRTKFFELISRNDQPFCQEDLEKTKKKLNLKKAKFYFFLNITLVEEDISKLHEMEDLYFELISRDYKP